MKGYLLKRWVRERFLRWCWLNMRKSIWYWGRCVSGSKWWLEVKEGMETIQQFRCWQGMGRPSQGSVEGSDTWVRGARRQCNKNTRRSGHRSNTLGWLFRNWGYQMHTILCSRRQRIELVPHASPSGQGEWLVVLDRWRPVDRYKRLRSRAGHSRRRSDPWSEWLGTVRWVLFYRRQHKSLPEKAFRWQSRLRCRWCRVWPSGQLGQVARGRWHLDYRHKRLQSRGCLRRHRLYRCWVRLGIVLRVLLLRWWRRNQVETVARWQWRLRCRWLCCRQLERWVQQ